MGRHRRKLWRLTFTRKAAGEFFDEILNKLARAASESAFAKKLAIEIGLPGWTTGEFLGLLRKVVDAMPALRLGTLDGFFARIARSFPLELGLGGKFELLEEHGVRVERARVLRQMFAHRGELDDAQKEFVESFKRATFGREEKRLGAQLDAFLDDHQEKFLSAPVGSLWGNVRKNLAGGESLAGEESPMSPRRCGRCGDGWKRAASRRSSGCAGRISFRNRNVAAGRSAFAGTRIRVEEGTGRLGRFGARQCPVGIRPEEAGTQRGCRQCVGGGGDLRRGWRAVATIGNNAGNSRGAEILREKLRRKRAPGGKS